LRRYSGRIVEVGLDAGDAGLDVVAVGILETLDPKKSSSLASSGGLAGAW
jgi:hypothetical protein